MAFRQLGIAPHDVLLVFAVGLYATYDYLRGRNGSEESGGLRRRLRRGRRSPAGETGVRRLCRSLHPTLLAGTGDGSMYHRYRNRPCLTAPCQRRGR